MKVHKEYIEADDGKILNCIWDGLYRGKTAYLGKVFYKDKIKLENPYELKVEDFEELDEDSLEVIDNKCFYFKNMSYSEIKTTIIKLHYSNDDQIAIMLNNDEEKMREMQEWREFASLTAKKYSN